MATDNDAEWTQIAQRVDAISNDITEAQAALQTLQEIVDRADRSIGMLDSDLRARLRTPPATD